MRTRTHCKRRPNNTPTRSVTRTRYGERTAGPTVTPTIALPTTATLYGVVVNNRASWGTDVTDAHDDAVTIRAARPDDVAAVARIWREGWREAHLGRVPDELVRARTAASFLERAGHLVDITTVAVISRQVAGFVMVSEDELQQLYVDSENRGGRIARPLIAAAEHQIADNDHSRAWLAVVPENVRARRFYERLGWSDQGQFDHAAPGPVGPIAVPANRYVKDVHPSARP